MTKNQIIQDDGLVTVASTKFEGMTDFIAVPVGHAAMRYSKPVADQVVKFLRTGKFAPRHEESN